MWFQKAPFSSVKNGVLLVGLGSPKSPSREDVREFLLELLLDPFMINLPWGLRQFFVRAFLVPKRLQEVAKSYERIWTPEGSPSLVYSKRFAEKLSPILPEDTHVFLGMRYQEPSLAEMFSTLHSLHLKKLIIFPLIPQETQALTGSLAHLTLSLLQTWTYFPSIFFISDYADEPFFLDASAKRLLDAKPEEYDFVLFSFHALPQRPAYKGYEERCTKIALSIAGKANLKREKLGVSFQSKMGKGHWSCPSTEQVIEELALEGKKRLLVFCPSFATDCLETLDEIGTRAQALFLEKGGEALHLVESLNDFTPWVEGCASTIKRYLM